MSGDDLAIVRRWRSPSALPGFGISLGFSLFYLSAIVLIPLSALVSRPFSLGWGGFASEVFQPRVLHALGLSFGAAAIAAFVNTIFGFIVAWALLRYEFPFKRLIDALVDLPYALPTAVAGIALATIYAPNGVLGSVLARLGIKAAFSPLGIVFALVFIGLPFVVRTLQPILAEIGLDAEEAAATLGATRRQTFHRVILPGLAPALITGASLAFARAVGEYGSVIFIAGNLPMVSEIAPLLIVIKLEEYDYAGAAAIGVIMLALSFSIILFLNVLQAWVQSRR
jgi:sulfate transport system permease protein